MSSVPLIPKQAAIAVADMVDNCAKVKPGMNVLLVAGNDGMYGGVNIVDSETISWLHSAIVQRGADATVVWCDIPYRPTVLWGEGADPGKAWRVPKIVAAAMKGADCIISNAVDLTFEEELRETADILEEHNIPYARNMATTGSLLTSNWGLTPYELVSEIRVQANALAVPGAKWVMTHPNGSHIEGYVVKPEEMDDYAHYRDIGVYRPFPEGVWSSIRARDAEGVGIINEIGVIWARHIGVPCPFKQPVKVFIEKGQIKKFEGGAEAETLTRFYQFIAKYLRRCRLRSARFPRRRPSVGDPGAAPVSQRAVSPLHRASSLEQFPFPHGQQPAQQDVSLPDAYLRRTARRQSQDRRELRLQGRENYQRGSSESARDRREV